MTVNRKGFGLLETMVGLVILSIGLAGISAMLKSGLKSATNLATKSDFSSLVQNLQLVLQDPNLCEEAFRNGTQPAKFNPTVTPASDFNRVTIGSQNIASVGMDKGSFTVTNLELKEISPGSAQLVNGFTQYATMLRISASKNRSWVGSRSIAHEYPVFVRTDAAGVIRHCSTQGSMSNSDLAPGDPKTFIAIAKIENLAISGYGEEMYSVPSGKTLMLQNVSPKAEDGEVDCTITSSNGLSNASVAYMRYNETTDVWTRVELQHPLYFKAGANLTFKATSRAMNGAPGAGKTDWYRCSYFATLVDEPLLQAPENFWQVRVNSGNPAEPAISRTVPTGKIAIIANISAKSDKFKPFKCRVSETGRSLYYHIAFGWPYMFARGLPRPIAFNPGNIFRFEILGSKGNKCDNIEKCECTYIGYYSPAP